MTPAPSSCNSEFMTAAKWATFKTSTVDFRSRPHLVGLTDEEVEQYERGGIDQDRINAIAFVMQSHAQALMFRVGGRPQ